METSRVVLSDPSTDVQAFQEALASTKIGPVFRWIEPWMLAPGGGGYPFVEWSDLGENERSIVLTQRVQKVIDHHGLDLSENAMRNIQWKMSEECVYAETQQQAYEVLAHQLQRGLELTVEARRVMARGPLPARTGHLMAEGGYLTRVTAMLREGKALTRKVVFNEPVNAFTMLYGDNIARGGDMLTGCTVTDTVEYETKGFNGKMKTVYTAKAVTL